jgi:hypothetical protein
VRHHTRARFLQRRRMQESARVLAHEPGQQNSSFHAETQVLLTQPLKQFAIRASKLATIFYASVEMPAGVSKIFRKQFLSEIACFRYAGERQLLIRRLFMHAHNRRLLRRNPFFSQEQQESRVRAHTIAQCSVQSNKEAPLDLLLIHFMHEKIIAANCRANARGKRIMKRMVQQIVKSGSGLVMRT